jgi:2-octaprenyl-6-methoxyphenol hydroxylase
MGKARQPVADVAIVGRGVTGHVLAAALAHASGGGLDIAVLDREAGSTPGAERALALSRGAVTMLGAIGIWPSIAPQARAMERIIVTDGRPGASQLSLLEFAGEGAGGPSAHVVDEGDLARAVAGAAGRAPGVRFIADGVAGFSPGAGAAMLELESGGGLAARLVVAADGARSAVRQSAGITTVGWSYGQSALVARVAHERDHHGVALERFLPAGPFAVLPLRGRNSSLVWTELNARADELVAAGREEVLAALAERWDEERGAIGRIGRLAAFALRFHVARRFVAPRLALVGDAAHQVHPLAGQGLNLGLRDVAALTEVVVDTLRLGLDPGAPPPLERYERWRRFDTVSSALAYDGLNRLFSNDRGAVRLIRDLGLGLVDRLPALKRAFMTEAAGGTGAVPKLMAGEAV